MLTVREASKELSARWELRSFDINGRAIKAIPYGIVPGGFHETIHPAPLKIGQLYVAELGALGGHGERFFVISPYGGYVEPPKVTVLQSRPLSTQNEH